MSVKRIRSKRRYKGSIFDIDDFTLIYEIGDLIHNPEKVPTDCETITLQEWGFTLEDFRKNHARFKQAFEKAWGG